MNYATLFSSSKGTCRLPRRVGGGRRKLCVALALSSLFILHSSFATAQTLRPAADFDSLFRRAEAYGEYWDTLNLFAYRGIGISNLPEQVELEVCDSLGLGFRAPTIGKVISRYGIRGRRPHQGTDIKVALGQPVFAAWDGIVRYSRYNSGGFGNLVIIRHANGLETYYAHLSKRAVLVGQRVEAGEVIGLGGRTGRASALHLHFEVRWYDQSFDAERLVDFETGALRTHTFTLSKEYFSSRARAGADELSTTDSVLMAATASASEQTHKNAVVLIPQELENQGVYHTVRSGDTLWSLARKHGTTVAAICDLNNITRNTTLRIGRTLQVK